MASEIFPTVGGAARILDPASTLGIMAVAVALLMIGGEFDLSAHKIRKRVGATLIEAELFCLRIFTQGGQVQFDCRLKGSFQFGGQAGVVAGVEFAIRLHQIAARIYVLFRLIFWRLLLDQRLKTF